LNSRRGLFGEDVEGKWSLRIADNAHFNLGSLACWSLHLFPAVCEDGGGICERCPGIVEGQLGDGDALASGIAAPAVPLARSQCGQTQQAAELAATVPFDRYTFTNLSSIPTCVTVTLATECSGSASIWSAGYSNRHFQLPGQHWRTTGCVDAIAQLLVHGASFIALRSNRKRLFRTGRLQGVHAASGQSGHLSGGAAVDSSLRQQHAAGLAQLRYWLRIGKTECTRDRHVEPSGPDSRSYVGEVHSHE
jgi:hypothetical protein